MYVPLHVQSRQHFITIRTDLTTMLGKVMLSNLTGLVMTELATFMRTLAGLVMTDGNLDVSCGHHFSPIGQAPSSS